MTAPLTREELRKSVELATEAVFNHSIALSRGRTHQDAADAIMQDIDAYIQSEVHKAVIDATTPLINLNAYDNQLSAQVSDIDAFNLFIRKWCPRAAHLLDSDDNDGQYMRNRLASLQKQLEEEK